MSQSRITGAVLLCWEDCTSILSKHLTTLLQRPIQLCRMVEDYDVLPDAVFCNSRNHVH